MELKLGVLEERKLRASWTPAQFKNLRYEEERSLRYELRVFWLPHPGQGSIKSEVKLDPAAARIDVHPPLNHSYEFHMPQDQNSNSNAMLAGTYVCQVRAVLDPMNANRNANTVASGDRVHSDSSSTATSSEQFVTSGLLEPLCWPYVVSNQIVLPRLKMSEVRWELGKGRDQRGAVELSWSYEVHGCSIVRFEITPLRYHEQGPPPVSTDDLNVDEQLTVRLRNTTDGPDVINELNVSLRDTASSVHANPLRSPSSWPSSDGRSSLSTSTPRALGQPHHFLSNVTSLISRLSPMASERKHTSTADPVEVYLKRIEHSPGQVAEVKAMVQLTPRRDYTFWVGAVAAYAITDNYLGLYDSISEMRVVKNSPLVVVSKPLVVARYVAAVRRDDINAMIILTLFDGQNDVLEVEAHTGLRVKRACDWGQEEGLKGEQKDALKGLRPPIRPPMGGNAKLYDLSAGGNATYVELSNRFGASSWPRTGLPKQSDGKAYSYIEAKIKEVEEYIDGRITLEVFSSSPPHSGSLILRNPILDADTAAVAGGFQFIPASFANPDVYDINQLQTVRTASTGGDARLNRLVLGRRSRPQPD